MIKTTIRGGRLKGGRVSVVPPRGTASHIVRRERARAGRKVRGAVPASGRRTRGARRAASSRVSLPVTATRDEKDAAREEART